MKRDFLIIGLGQMGCSLAFALRKAGLAEKIWGVDLEWRNHYRGLIDGFAKNWQNFPLKGKIIILSTPVREIIQLVRDIGPEMEENTILMDTGSTKREILRQMRNFKEKIMIGGHPMAGSIRKGEKAVNPGVFSGVPFFLTFPSPFSKKGEKVVKEVIRGIGAIPVEIEEEVHDFCISVTSHLPYIVSLSLFSLLLGHKIEGMDQFIATGFLGATRLALTPPEVAEDILMTNRDNVEERIEDLIDLLQEVRDALGKEGPGKWIRKIYREAEKRREIYEDSGF